MSSKTSKTFRLLTIALGLLAITHCGKSSRQETAFLPTTAESEPLSAKPFEASLNGLDLDHIQLDALWALSQDDLAPYFSRSYLVRHSLTSGNMPQVLLPKVRQRIRDNEHVKMLLNAPAILQQMLAQMFANDSKLATEIRETAGQTIADSQLTQYRLDNEIKFNLDGFTSPLLPQSPAVSELDHTVFSFSTEQQAVRWSFVLSRPQLWQGKVEPSASYLDPSIQMLHLFRTLMEWDYLFGISKHTDGKAIGGLTIPLIPSSAGGQVSAPLAYFDPREEGSSVNRAVSGVYTIEYPQQNALDLALHGGETWHRLPQKISLDEQVKTWIASAIAFKRLRPYNRPNTLALFGGPNPLPAEIHLLSFAFLPAMETLLSSFFIDVNNRVIKAFACEDGDPSAEEADLRTHARLIQALALWTIELSNIDDIGPLNARIREKLENAPQKLLRVMQLALQNIFYHFTKSVRLPDGTEALAFVNKDNLGAEQSTELSDIAGAAEAIAVLATVDNNLLHSRWLKGKLKLLHNWLYNEVFLPEATGKSNAKLSPAETLWLYQALRNASQATANPQQAETTPASGQGINLLKKVIDKWNENFL